MRGRSRLPFVAWPLVLAGMASAGGGALAPSAALDLPPLRSLQSPSFTADVTVSIDSTGAPGLAVSVQLPYGELQWVRTSGGYRADVEVTVVFESEKHGTGYGDSWERHLIVGSFPQTLSAGTGVAERHVFPLPPGRYELRVHVQDLNSSMRSTASERLTVPDYSRSPVSMADLELGVLTVGGAFEPRATRRFGLDSDRLAGRVVVIDRRSGSWPRNYALRYRILDESGAELQRGQRTSALSGPGAPLIVRPDSVSLFVGAYSLEVELEAGKSRLRVERSFEVEESGPPKGRDFERMLEPLAYIADPEEIETLRRLAEPERAEGWAAFWRRRDPTPDTPRNEALIEFMNRVRYVEAHFQHFGPGWRSDMGRIYIKFGPPDQVDSRPATADSSPTEIWYYERPQREFVFVDREGFGRFVLVSPTTE